MCLFLPLRKRTGRRHYAVDMLCRTKAAPETRHISRMIVGGFRRAFNRVNAYAVNCAYIARRRARWSSRGRGRFAPKQQSSCCKVKWKPRQSAVPFAIGALSGRDFGLRNRFSILKIETNLDQIWTQLTLIRLRISVYLSRVMSARRDKRPGGFRVEPPGWQLDDADEGAVCLSTIGC